MPSALHSTAVSVQHLHKSFKPQGKSSYIHAVQDVNFDIQTGEIYGLIGPNGSGKSTTMKAILGLIKPSQGQCFIFGKNPTKTDTRHEVGYLPENPYFYKHLSGKETLLFYGKLCGLKGANLEEQTSYLLEKVGLQDAAKRRIGTYSKGMLQRIGLAQALIQAPRLLVLDEPTAGVDPVGSREIRDIILNLKSEGCTILLCSHLLEQVQEICDQVGILHQGKLIRQGTLKQLLEQENQSEILLQNTTPEILEEVQKYLQTHHPQVHWLGHGSAKSTLEQIFLTHTQTKL